MYKWLSVLCLGLLSDCNCVVLVSVFSLLLVVVSNSVWVLVSCFIMFLCRWVGILFGVCSYLVKLGIGESV